MMKALPAILMKALPAILMSVGALMAIGVPGLTIARHVQLQLTGLAGPAAGAEHDIVVLALFSIFAVPVGILLMVSGYLVRRSRIMQKQAAEQRRAKRQAADAARRRPYTPD